MPSKWCLVLLVLCERNETCRGEGGTAASPGPPPWFYRCVNPIRVAFTPVPGNLKRNTHHLFFLVPCASSPAPAGPSRRVRRRGAKQGAQCLPGAGMTAGRCLAPASRRRQHPGFRLSSPALHRMEAAFSGCSVGPGEETGRPGASRPSGFPGLPLTPPGAGVGTGPPPNPGVIPESGSRAGGR